jgi:hypothetical protein
VKIVIIGDLDRIGREAINPHKRRMSVTERHSCLFFKIDPRRQDRCRFFSGHPHWRPESRATKL